MPAWLIALDRTSRSATSHGDAGRRGRHAGLLCVGGLRPAAWLALLGWRPSRWGVRDLVQTSRALLRNYPIIGHIRYLLGGCGRNPPVLLESDREAAVHRVMQRSLVYQRSKNESDKRPSARSWTCWPRVTSGSTIH